VKGKTRYHFALFLLFVITLKLKNLDIQKYNFERLIVLKLFRKRFKPTDKAVKGQGETRLH